jgi:hypothetical protein
MIGRKASFLKKRSKKLLQITRFTRADSVLPETDKSFLVLFFKKKQLPFFLLLLSVHAASAESAAALGARLYNGGAPLNGTVGAQGMSLPASVLICANCHVGQPGNQPGGDAQAAPDLRRGWLRQVRSRRNGPAGHYTEITFCRALRTGIDPLHIVLPVQMPRFAIADADCAALWDYLDALP